MVKEKHNEEVFMGCIKAVHAEITDWEIQCPLVSVPFSVVHVAIALQQTVISALFAIITEVGYQITQDPGLNEWKNSLWKDARIGLMYTCGSLLNALTLGFFYTSTDVGLTLSANQEVYYQM
jgi:hypothetical protein